MYENTTINEAMVAIPQGEYRALITMAEQRSAVLRYALASRYSVDKEMLFTLCNEQLPTAKEVDI